MGPIDPATEWRRLSELYGRMSDGEPKDEPEQERREREEAAKGLDVRCPKCHSTEVVFDELSGEPPTKEEDSPLQYEWTCDSCGHHWKDHGIVEEA